jgi:predicted porin
MNTTSLRTVAALTTAIAAAWSPTLVQAQAQAQPAAAPAAVPTAAATLLSGMTLYGTLDAAVTQRQLAGEKKVKSVNSGQMTTSFIALKGSYDLGDAYSANFDMASFVRADLGSSGRNDTDTFWSKYAWVGLGTPWGQVRMGPVPAMEGCA